MLVAPGAASPSERNPRISRRQKELKPLYWATESVPGAVATGSYAQLEWQHPLATARGSVPFSPFHGLNCCVTRRLDKSPPRPPQTSPLSLSFRHATPPAHRSLFAPRIPARPGWSSPINFAPVSNSIDANFVLAIVDLINYPVIADTNSPVVFSSRQFSATCRARILSQRLNRRNDAVMQLRG